jgi:hypothetical protein
MILLRFGFLGVLLVLAAISIYVLSALQERAIDTPLVSHQFQERKLQHHKYKETIEATALKTKVEANQVMCLCFVSTLQYKLVEVKQVMLYDIAFIRKFPLSLW